MISLGKFLAHQRECAVGPLQNLLIAVGRTALRTGSPDRERFQQQVESAAKRIMALAQQMARLGMSGVNVKEELPMLKDIHGALPH